MRNLRPFSGQERPPYHRDDIKLLEKSNKLASRTREDMDVRIPA